MNKTHILFTINGIIWGVILGALAAYFIGGGVSGLFYIYVFGDNEWPAWFSIVIYFTMALAGLLVFTTCFFLIRRYARHVIENGSSKKGNRQAVISLIIAVLVISGYVILDNKRTDLELRQSQSRLIEHTKRLENTSSTKKPGESDVAYYCRVICRHTGKSVIDYHGYRVKIYTTVLPSDNPLFAVEGPYNAVKMIANEAIITEPIAAGRKELLTGFIPLPIEITCGEGVYFIQAKSSIYSNDLSSLEKVEISLPSIHVLFPMTVWRK